jgi:hypothetical protein
LENIEPEWLNINMINEIGWDNLMCTENNNITIMKELMQKALIATLNP